ncbi:hypothetical protein OUZ56_003352 [Daphnia magna]|uniref:HAT C-terminal dimerisation domain-containing protein n=1 Tax=Daphnia magna TaxID=35525 RepID=A0ABR0A8H9_9CRUS|nr:hypothetical protein OUZ56_003352 [Daphnia magna]
MSASLSWLEDESDVSKALSYICSVFEQNQDQCDPHSNTSDEDTDGTTSSKSDPSPVKLHKRKLSKYPTVQKIYKRFNIALQSSASVERLISQGGLIYVPKRTNLIDKSFEMLLPCGPYNTNADSSTVPLFNIISIFKSQPSGSGSRNRKRLKAICGHILHHMPQTAIE